MIEKLRWENSKMTTEEALGNLWKNSTPGHYIITDPIGSQMLQELAEKNGYEIRVMNVSGINKSSGFNALNIDEAEVLACVQKTR